MLAVMKTDERLIHITDDMGNDVVNPRVDKEYEALCAVADAAEQEHRAHCLLLTSNCPLCRALAKLDSVRQQSPLYS
jgi:hypothetical protein